MQNFVFREKGTMKNAEKTPETLRFSGVFLVPYYTIPKIKRELKHVYGYFRIFSHYTTLYAAYAKPISTFEELQNVNLAPYENYVLTNDIIEGNARARGRRAGRAYLLSKRKTRKTEKREWRACGQQIGRMYGQQVG